MVSMALLVLSLAALGVGPVAFAIVRRTRWAILVLESFAIVALFGVLVLDVLPEAVAAAGVTALVAAAIGLVLPSLAERHAHGAAHARVDAKIAFLALSGLALHAILDGTALRGDGASRAANALGVAVVLHRVPVSLAVWSMIRPRQGGRAAWLVLATYSLFTIVGFASGGFVLEALAGRSLAIYQALVAGSLLHVAYHNGGLRLVRRVVEGVLPGSAAAPVEIGPIADVREDAGAIAYTSRLPVLFGAAVALALLAVLAIAHSL